MTVVASPLKVFWWNRLVNFGDLITPALLEKFGIPFVHSEPADADLVATGSILHLFPRRFPGIIVGSGFITDGRARSFSCAKVFALRGRLSKRRAKITEPIVLGDPGLLAGDLLQTRPAKTYAIGIVPHYIDSSDSRLRLLKSRYPTEIKLIDVQRDALKVIEDIDRCEYILSSSLHGLVVADSLSIPSAWLALSDGIYGRGFKFHDYASAMDCIQQPKTVDGRETLGQLIALTERKPDEIERVRAEVRAAVRDALMYAAKGTPVRRSGERWLSAPIRWLTAARSRAVR